LIRRRANGPSPARRGPIDWSHRPPCPFPSLANVWGPLVDAVFFPLLVTEVDSMVESYAAPTSACLAPHVEPLLNSSRARAACSTILFAAAAIVSSL
jgi:hypothetical protein